MQSLYGLEIEQVRITKFQITYPKLTGSLPVNLEVERLKKLDNTIRRVSNRTLQHVEEISRSQTDADVYRGTVADRIAGVKPE